MSLIEILTAFENSPIGVAVRESALLFPWLESVHVIAATILLGSVGVIDARLLGWLSKDEPVSRLNDDLLPVVWAAFALALGTGAALFCGAAVKYAADLYFQVKMLVLLAAGLNMAVFHVVTYRRVGAWDNALPPPAAARAAGAASLALWLGAVALGRIIGFSLN